jgi:serine/threonine protein kinase
MIINNKYLLIEKIGNGSFGSIYKGQNIRTKEFVAVKVENIKTNYKLLKNESIIYQYLNNNKGIPNIKWFGKDTENYYMVINLLGKSLQEIKNKLQKFSLSLILKIGIKIIQLLEMIHEKNLVHRDIKPDNFLFDSNNNLYIIDFGFCKTYIENNKHISIKNTHGLIGSYMYASINAHKYNELSRRDDLESLGYMLIYFYLDFLPWQYMDCKLENNKIIEEKKNIINKENLPDVFIQYMNYVRNLLFDEKPNYSFIINNLVKKIDLL